MSLAGNLSDLSLAELLQVVALSRKTGALEICSDAGVAWLGLRDGGIVRVAMEDGAVDRTEVLKRAGVNEENEPDVAEATLWDAAVAGILKIFEWEHGEFMFEPLEDPAESWRGPEGIVLPTALSPEFLALEGARLSDEGGFADPDRETPEPTAPRLDADEDDELGVASDPNDWSEVNDELPAVRTAQHPPAPAPTPVPEPPVLDASVAEELDEDDDELGAEEPVVAVEAHEPADTDDVVHAAEMLESDDDADLDEHVVEAELSDDATPLRVELEYAQEAPLDVRAAADVQLDADAEPESDVDIEDDAEDEVVVAADVVVEDDDADAASTRVAPAPSVVICLHSDLVLLEALKEDLASDATHVHIFQSANDALARIKQYIVRGEFPALVFGSGMHDPVAAPGSGWRPLFSRVRALSPRGRMVLLVTPADGTPDDIASVLTPDGNRATSDDMRDFFDAVREALATLA